MLEMTRLDLLNYLNIVYNIIYVSEYVLLPLFPEDLLQEA